MRRRGRRVALLAALALGLAVGLGGCGTRNRDAHVKLTKGHAVAYTQTFELTESVADGEPQPALKIEHAVTLRCLRDVGDGAWEVALDYGRARVWVERLDGEPALDTQDRGYAAAEELFARPNSGLAELLASFWAMSAGTASKCFVDTHGFVVEPTIDRLIAKRLDDNRAADLGSGLLEDALTDPALFFVPLGHGDGPWKGELELVSALWGPGLQFETDTAVTARDDAAISFSFTGAGTLLPAWGKAGAAQRRSADEETEGRKARLARLQLERQSLTGDATVAWDDGLPNRLAWTLVVVTRDPGDDAWRESATLRYTLKRAPIE